MGRDGSQPAARFLLPLIAAVVLFAGACGASVAEDGRGTPANTATREDPGGPSGEMVSLPGGPPDITGTVTEVERGKPGAGSAGRILVEEDPAVAKVGEKLYFEVRDETRVFIRRGGGRGDARPGTAGDLAKGQTVDAWHTGHPVMESYPGQTVASRVVIHGPPPARSAVFFPVQSSESADAMDALLRGELTLDGEGCLHVEDPKHDVDAVPVWPAGFEPVTSGDEIRVLDERERVVGRVGEGIVLGGGEVAFRTLEDNNLVQKPLLRELLGRCPGDYWLVSPY